MVAGAIDKSPGRLASLDGLRGLAICLVIIHHVAIRYLTEGSVGVDIFFALCGYLLTASLLREFAKRGTISLKVFYTRRMARLLPALIMVLLATSGAIILNHYLPVAWRSRHSPASWKEVLFAGTFTMNWVRALHIGIGDDLLGHTWSLAVIEQFYLLWPPLLFAVLRWRKNSAASVTIGLAVVSALWSLVLHFQGASFERNFNGFDTRAVELLIGSSLAFLPFDGRLADWLARHWYMPAIALAVELVAPSMPLIPAGFYGIMGLLSAWLILAALKGAPSAALWENPVLGYVGRISYGLYLWHYMLLHLIEAHAPFHRAIVDGPALAAAFVIASLSYRFVEAPISAAAHRMTSSPDRVVPQDRKRRSLISPPGHFGPQKPIMSDPSALS